MRLRSEISVKVLSKFRPESRIFLAEFPYAGRDIRARRIKMSNVMLTVSLPPISLFLSCEKGTEE